MFEPAPADRTGGPPRPRVVVIFTGGTIAMLPDPATGAAVPALRGEELLARLPDAGTAADLEAVDWGLVPASHLRFAQVLDIAALIRAAAPRADVSGVVVVQGTDVLEETAFAWDLLHGAETAGGGRGRHAQRRPGRTTTARATWPTPCGWRPTRAMRGQGVVVVMDGLVLPADDATKMHSQALDAFQAPNAGAAGSGRRMAAWRSERERGDRRRILAWPERAAEPVALLTAVVSTDGDLLRAALRGGVAGVVVEATGSGNTDPDLLAAAVEAMAAGIPVVLATRCAAGGVGPFYGFPGGGRSWQEAGALLAGIAERPQGTRGAGPGPGRRARARGAGRAARRSRACLSRAGPSTSSSAGASPRWPAALASAGRRPWPSSGGRVMAVGTRPRHRGARRAARRCSWRLRPGLVVTPSLTDAHLHLALAALAAESAGPHGPGPGRGRGGHLRGPPAPARAGRRDRLAAGPRLVLRRAGRAARRRPPGRGGPGRPVALWAHDHHSRWLSSAADRAGRHRRPRGPALGPHRARRSTGRPRAILYEHAAGLVDGVIPVPDDGGGRGGHHGLRRATWRASA